MVLADGHLQLAGQVLGVDVVAGLDAAGDLPVKKFVVPSTLASRSVSSLPSSSFSIGMWISNALALV